MNPSEIKQIIEAVCATDIKKFKYANNGIKIEIDRNEAVAGIMAAPGAQGQLFQPHPIRTVDMTTDMRPQSSNNQGAPVATLSAEPIETAAPLQPVVADHSDVVVSPIVGVFYASPTPESPTYAAVGKLIKKGEILCIVEAMKVMNEITAEYDLVVVEVLASNEQLVEFGQPLFKVQKQ